MADVADTPTAHPTDPATAARRLGEHAIVIGAGIAGLLAARVLSDAYDRVTVLDRDTLPAGIGEGRRAIPQGRHIHGMQPGGQLALEQLFPGFCAGARAAGAPTLAFGLEMRFRVGGHLLARVDIDGDYVLSSRPLLEGLVRRRVRSLPNVTLRDRCAVLALVAAEGDGGARVAGEGRGGGRIAGVRVRDGAPGSQERTLRADLVVAASGRGAKVAAWLGRLGYPRAAEERVDVDILYASRYLRLRPGDLPGDRVVLDDAHPGRPRGIAAQLEEGDRWSATLYGYGPAHHPPHDDAGWRAFAATVGDPAVRAAIEHAEPVSDIATHAFPASVRRRYDRLERFPAGLLVIGDALCAFNPIYGQGMSVAALEAVALQRVLREGDDGLAARFFTAARVPVDEAWNLAAGADRALPELGLRVALPDRVLNRYVDRLIAVAEHDDVLARIFYEVSGMVAPASHMLTPRAALRVLRGSVGRRR